MVQEFHEFKHEYSLKRGFSNSNAVLGIESVAQPLVALHGDYVSANRGKNYVFEIKTAYDNAFHESKAQHILLAFCIAKSIEQVKWELKNLELPIESQSLQLQLLQSLKSRYFIVSVIGKIIDEITGKPINSKVVKFLYDSSRSTSYTMQELISLWVPVVKAILPPIIKRTGTDLNSFLSSKEDPLGEVSSNVKDMLSTIRSMQPIESLDILAKHLE